MVFHGLSLTEILQTLSSYKRRLGNDTSDCRNEAQSDENGLESR